MTFLSRRKRPTIRRAFPARLARKTISAAILWLAVLSSARAQSYLTINSIKPKFTAAGQPASSVEPPLAMPQDIILPAAYQQPKPPTLIQVRGPGKLEDDGVAPYVPVDLPGPQRFFRRDSEGQFFARVIHERKKEFAGSQAIFPETPILTKEPFRPRSFPRMMELVEPCYVAHRRLFFEQPNFERAGYSFGVLQPAICLGVFYYDLALLPYHAFSDLRGLGETNVGKCLPGDPSPLLFPRERFSVTGLVGQGGVVAGGLFLFP